MQAAALRLAVRRAAFSPLNYVNHQKQVPFGRVFYFSTDEKKKDHGGTSSLRDSVNRIKIDDEMKTKGQSESNEEPDDILRKASDMWSGFGEAVSETWQELLQAGKPKDINKKLHVMHPEESPETGKDYKGSVEIMVIDPSENLTAWERMQKRLAEAPIIDDIISRSQEVYETSGAKDYKQKVDHLKEDAQEAWETSQNPWVYRASSVYDTLTVESELTVAVRELRELDPDFNLEVWQKDVVEHTLPQIMQWFLEGRIEQLEPWLGEAVFNRIAAEAKARKQEGVQIDTHVLSIMNSEIIACEVRESWSFVTR